MRHNLEYACKRLSKHCAKMIQPKESNKKKTHTDLQSVNLRLSPWERFSFSLCRMTADFFSSFLFAESFNSEGHEIACNKHKRDKFYWFFKHNKKNMHWMKMMDLANFQFVRFEMLSEERKMDERAFCYYAKTATFCPNHYLLHNLSLMASKW